MVRRFVTPGGATPHLPPAFQYDGGGYLVRIEGDFVAGDVKGGTMILSGQDETPVGRWAMETREALRPCWTSLTTKQP